MTKKMTWPAGLPRRLPLRRGVGWAILFLSLAVEPGPLGAFQPPLTQVEALLETNGFAITVRYRAFDPELDAWQESSHRYPGSSFEHWVPANLTVAGGIVAWRAYAMGTLATADTEVRFAVYDPARAAWQLDTRRYQGSSTFPWVITNLTVNSGVVAWRLLPGVGSFSWDTAIGFATYDPANSRGAWVQHERRYQGTSLAYWATANLTVADSLVAWQAVQLGQLATFDTQAGFAIYNPVTGQWAADQHNYPGHPRNFWVISGLTVQNHSVRWTATNIFGTTSEIRGFALSDEGIGTWQSGSTLPVASFVSGQKAHGQPGWFWFTDMSLGATNWIWAFGDGRAATSRSPQHTFSAAGPFTVTQTVSGPRGRNSASQVIEGDWEPPTGSITINDGAEATANRDVLLSILASDNGGPVQSMRLSNDQLVWTDWEPFQNNRAWQLTPGLGLKTVSVQFRDVEQNVSAIFQDTISFQHLLSFDPASVRIDGDLFRARVTGLAEEATVVISWSSDLLSWRALTTNSTGPGAFDFSDPFVSGPAIRFFRAELR